MMHDLLSAFAQILSGTTPLYLIAGVLLGLMVGILPGFGGSVGLALLLPFIYGLDQVSGLALMLGVMSVVATSDTFPAVLIGIPGSVSSQATVEDGFPLAKRGEAARALAAGFVASLFGGLFGAVILTLVLQIARPIVLAFGTGEMLMLSVFGLTMVGVLSGSSFLKGLMTAMLGLCIGMIGITPATNEYRMEFEILYFSNGIPLMVIAISVFAIPEIIDLMRRDSAISERATLRGGWLNGVRDAIRHRWLVLRCSGLGTFLGMLPGLGGTVVDWVAYAHAVQTAKDKTGFGKGDIRGVLAPESSNNAKEGGALVPTLIFGIPGSAATAILLGGMILLGVQPGVQMVTREIELVYTIIWSLALANILGAVLCVVLAQPISRLTTIDFKYIAPFLIAMVLFAAFQSTRAWGDLIVATGIGIFAYFLRRYGFPRPALMIGFVLAYGLETNFYQTTQFYGWSVFQRPLFLALVAICLLSAWAGYLLLKAQRSAEGRPRYGSSAGQIAITLTMVGAAVFVLVTTWGLTPGGRLFPQVIALPMLGLSLVTLFLVWRSPPGSPIFCDLDRPDGVARVQRSAWPQVAWVVGLLAGTLLIGFWLAVGLFAGLFLHLRSGVSPVRALLGGAAALGVLALLAWLLSLDFPRGLLQDMWDLPFPLDT
ncbi:tripartite tricarboxylate transporter permease [Pontivivens ytuae]|uniref:Tripartite tricarboxylate transporter permease n=1 Tax=Pontivivens ytuae TaxID=2789856 RepID=A0A7S9LRE8_9RHOB|nr:tripartite tricarboxylate transporter permease [Pontivivens ytuae]QPH53355.1 tripartite tricarboxylate transporter permease [Pontivivens ytuae]